MMGTSGSTSLSIDSWRNAGRKSWPYSEMLRVHWQRIGAVHWGGALGRCIGAVHWGGALGWCIVGMQQGGAEGSSGDGMRQAEGSLLTNGPRPQQSSPLPVWANVDQGGRGGWVGWAEVQAAWVARMHGRCTCKLTFRIRSTPQTCSPPSQPQVHLCGVQLPECAGAVDEQLRRQVDERVLTRPRALLDLFTVWFGLVWCGFLWWQESEEHLCKASSCCIETPNAPPARPPTSSLVCALPRNAAFTPRALSAST